MHVYLQHGLYSCCLYSYSHQVLGIAQQHQPTYTAAPYIAMAYIVMTYTVMASGATHRTAAYPYTYGLYSHV